MNTPQQAPTAAAHDSYRVLLDPSRKSRKARSGSLQAHWLFGLLQTFWITQSCRRCSASFNERLEDADVVWIYSLGGSASRTDEVVCGLEEFFSHATPGWLAMHRLRRRLLLSTEIAKAYKHRLLTETSNFRQAVGLIQALNKISNPRHAVGLVHLLLRSGNLRETKKLIRSLHEEGNFKFVFPFTPGHYSSPLPASKEIASRSQALFDRSVTMCSGIDLREEAQLELLENFSSFYDDLPFPTQPGETTRYYYDNGWFGYGDAITL